MDKNTYLFTSESVSPAHPDKLADRISDSILDEFLKQDKNAKVACETLTTTGLVVLAGEIKAEAYVDLQEITRKSIFDVGYNNSDLCFDSKSCAIISALHEQSPDINRGVTEKLGDDAGAGDQGIMFGYAVKESGDSYMPATLYISNLILQVLFEKMKTSKFLRPDAKSQVSINYDRSTEKPISIDTIVVSTQHSEFDTDENMQKFLKNYILTDIIPEVIKQSPEDLKHLFNSEFKLLVNPTGKFVIGGPHGDSGLTGRKIIVDTYGGRGAHGGGAFSGKDPSKVDRSAAYMARYIAKNLVAARVADEILVQLSYAIGVAQPVSINVKMRNSKYSADMIESFIKENFDLRPASIIKFLGLKNPIYQPTSSFGHFGRTPYEKDGIRFFTWEEIDVNLIDKLDIFSDIFS